MVRQAISIGGDHRIECAGNICFVPVAFKSTGDETVHQ
jgi:hypothetical protein